MRLFKSKSGNWPDPFVFTAAAIVLGIMLSILFFFTSSVNENLLNLALVNDTAEAKAVVTNNDARLPFIFDMILPLLYLGFLIFSGVSARSIKTSHMLTPIVVFVGTLIIMFAMVVEVVWDKFTSGTNDLAVKVQELLLTNAMMDSFIFVALIYILVVGISLYTKDD